MFKLVALLSSAILANAAQQVLLFDNVGFLGTYNQVSSLKDLYSDDCSCLVSLDTVSFSGTNAPLNEELSVHFRGPLTLSKFAYYVSEDFTIDGSDSLDWSRLAYYDASEQTADNVTFLTKAGKNSTCLGKALTYADSDGVSKASEATVLKEGTLINSDDEYVIFSNITCDDSGLDNDCGVYRSGIPAYHGYYGTVKMFLFEFTMPEESTVLEKSSSNYNMPAIWLLNAHIPRTSQYATNTNCSCWRSGCGEFDIFEVKNNTDDEVKRLYATVHDYQGTDDIETGLQVDGYFDRDYNSTMKGGVIFDNDGNIITFLNDDTDFDSTLKASSVQDYVANMNEASLSLSSVSAASTATDTSSKDSSASQLSGFSALLASCLLLLV